MKTCATDLLGDDTAHTMCDQNNLRLQSCQADVREVVNALSPPYSYGYQGCIQSRPTASEQSHGYLTHSLSSHPSLLCIQSCVYGRS